MTAFIHTSELIDLSSFFAKNADPRASPIPGEPRESPAEAGLARLAERGLLSRLEQLVSREVPEAVAIERRTLAAGFSLMPMISFMHLVAPFARPASIHWIDCETACMPVLVYDDLSAIASVAPDLERLAEVLKSVKRLGIFRDIRTTAVDDDIRFVMTADWISLSPSGIPARLRGPQADSLRDCPDNGNMSAAKLLAA